MASRNASVTRLSFQGGGIIGGGVPFLIASPSRDTTSMTRGGGRVPVTPSAVAASAIRWLEFSAATRRARRSAGMGPRAEATSCCHLVSGASGTRSGSGK